MYDKFITGKVTNSSWSSSVKIAVLDTGADIDHPSLQAYEDRIKGLRNWTRTGSVNDIADQLGHGTHIANLLLQYCPHAELYIAKIADEGEPDPGAVAKVAIGHCITLFMSLTSFLGYQTFHRCQKLGR